VCLAAISSLMSLFALAGGVAGSGFACLLALGVVGAATVISAIPVAVAWRGKNEHLMLAVLTSIVIRLLLVTMGVVIIVLLVRISPGWFVGWLALFYVLTLVFETLVVLSRMSVRTKQKAQPCSMSV